MPLALSPIRRAFTLIELLTVVAIIGILAAMITGAVLVVQKKAKIAATQKVYQEWISGLEGYKSAYGMYPYIGDTSGTGDRYIDLSDKARVAEFIKCLSGKTPLFDGNPGAALSSGDAKKYNKNGQGFVDFNKDSLQVGDNNQYTGMLADRFGNTKIRIYMDTDNNGIITNPKALGELTPAENYGVVNNAVAAKIIIYTLKRDDTKGEGFEDVLSWQP